MNLAWLYVAALYAIAIFLARRAGVLLPGRIALFFYALVLGLFLGPLTRDQSNIHNDFLRTLPPWMYVNTEREALNPELNDVPLQHVPWAHQVRKSWRSLSVPLWNPNAGSGYPLLANGQSSALSPIRIAALPLPLAQAMAAEAAMKLLIALTFTFLFCRGRGASQFAAIAGAVSFGLAGFLNVWLHFPHVTAGCFLPAVLYLIDRLAERPTRGVFLTSVAVWVSIVFAGHPETASHIFLLALLYVLWIVFIEKRAPLKLFLTLGGALTLAALLSAPFLAPFLEALPRSQRYESLKESPLDARKLGFSDFPSMIVMFQPHFFGRAPTGKTWGPAVTETVGGFTGMLAFASFFAIAFRVAVRRTWRSAEAFFVIATVLVFGLISSWTVLGDVVHFILPVVAHARLRLLFVMLMAIHVAAAIDLGRQGERRPLLVGVGIATALLGALLAFSRYPEPGLQHDAMLAAIPSVIVLFATALFVMRPRRAVQLALLAAVVAEMAPVTRGWNPSLSSELMFPETPLIRRLEELRDEQPVNQPFRIAATGAALFPNTGAIYGFEDIRAHDPMANAAYLRFLRITAGYDAWQYHATHLEPNASVYDFLNVRYLLTNPGVIAYPDPERWRGIYAGRDGYIFQNLHFLPRFYAVRNVIADFDATSFTNRLRTEQDWGQTAILDALKVESRQMHDDFFTPRPEGSPLAVAQIVEAGDTDYRLRVRAARYSLVVSSIPFWPGWKVERNGQRIDAIRVNGAFLGFAVPPGEVDVRVWYEPWSFRAGWLVALATLMGMAMYRMYERRFVR